MLPPGPEDGAIEQGHHEQEHPEDQVGEKARRTRQRSQQFCASRPGRRVEIVQIVPEGRQSTRLEDLLVRIYQKTSSRPMQRRNLRAMLPVLITIAWTQMIKHRLIRVTRIGLQTPRSLPLLMKKMGWQTMM